MANPPVDLSVAHHLNPNHKAAFSSTSLLGHTERFKEASEAFWKNFRFWALALRALNATYQSELMEEMGRQMDAGTPNPALWEEICYCRSQAENFLGHVSRAVVTVWAWGTPTS